MAALVKGKPMEHFIPFRRTDVVSMCADELESAGGPSGEGTAAAQELGGCVQMNCDMECSQGGGGGAGGGG